MNAHMRYANLRRRRYDLAEQREILRRCGIPLNRHRPSWYRHARHDLRHTARQWALHAGTALYTRVGFTRHYRYRVDA